jgi:MFS family permease
MFLFSRAGDLRGLFLARMAQGLGSSFLWIAAYTIATDLAPSGERGGAVGRVDEAAARGSLYGAIAGFTLFSMMAPDVGWQVVLTAYAVAAAVGAWVGWRNVPETRTVASAPAESKHESGSWSLSAPLLRLMVIVFTTGASSAMVWPIFLIFLQDRFTPDVGTLAVVYVPAGIAYSYLPSRLGRLSDRYGRTRLMAIGLVGSGVVSLLLPRLPNLIWLGVLFTLEAVGWTIAAPAEEAMVADLTGKAVRGRGYGIYTFARMLGMTLGPLIGGWLYDSVGQAVPFYINGIILLFGAVWVLVALRQVRPIEAAA